MLVDAKEALKMLGSVTKSFFSEFSLIDIDRAMERNHGDPHICGVRSGKISTRYALKIESGGGTDHCYD